MKSPDRQRASSVIKQPNRNKASQPRDAVVGTRGPARDAHASNGNRKCPIKTRTQKRTNIAAVPIGRSCSKRPSSVHFIQALSTPSRGKETILAPYLDTESCVRRAFKLRGGERWHKCRIGGERMPKYNDHKLRQGTRYKHSQQSSVRTNIATRVL